MKKIYSLIAVLMIAAFLTGCSTMSWDTFKYANGTKNEIQTGPCVVSIDAPAPVVIPPKVTKIKILEPVMFDWDKSFIRTDQEAVIKKVAALMDEYPDTVLALNGHASIEGPENYNLELSQARADSVKDALIVEGVDADRIVSAIGKGEVSIFGELLKLNRRVVVLSVE